MYGFNVSKCLKMRLCFGISWRTLIINLCAAGKVLYNALLLELDEDSASFPAFDHNIDNPYRDYGT
jgi:hypothetical protein